MSSFSRGSEWLRWEPHIHAPGTMCADEFGDDWDGYVAALETASPKIHAIGVTDYGVTRSYEAVVARQKAGHLQGRYLFPNIELRLNTGTVKGNFVNIHLLVCPDDSNHLTELNRFLRQIVFKAFDDTFTCTPEDLIRLGRRADSKLTDDDAARRHGYSQFKYPWRICSKHTGRWLGPVKTSLSLSRAMRTAPLASRKRPIQRCAKRSKRPRTRSLPAVRNNAISGVVVEPQNSRNSGSDMTVRSPRLGQRCS